jgi:hypothetical protein
MNKLSLSFWVLGLATTLLIWPGDTKACTNVIVTKGASADGSTIVSYSADSHDLYGELYHWPAQTYPMAPCSISTNGTRANIWAR